MKMGKNKIKKLREAMGLSQIQLAIKLGVGVATIGRWEQGMDPDPENKQKVAEFFGVNEEAVTGMEGE